MSFYTERVFDRVLVIMFENQYRSYVLRTPTSAASAPGDRTRQLQRGHAPVADELHRRDRRRTLRRHAGRLTRNTPAARTIVDLLEEAPGHLRWKGYMESFDPAANRWSELCSLQMPVRTTSSTTPSPRSTTSSAASGAGSRSTPKRRSLPTCLTTTCPSLRGSPPTSGATATGWMAPNRSRNPRAPFLVDQQAQWLSAFFGRLNFPGPKSHLPTGTLVVVTFDESDFEQTWASPCRAPTTGPTRSTPCCWATCSRPPSARRATTTTACCAPSSATST